jgi:hypothetical protein
MEVMHERNAHNFPLDLAVTAQLLLVNRLKEKRKKKEILFSFLLLIQNGGNLMKKKRRKDEDWFHCYSFGCLRFTRKVQNRLSTNK